MQQLVRSVASFSSLRATAQIRNVSNTIKLARGVELPKLAFGTWLSKKAGASVLHALKTGYRHVDCAAVYENEEQVGEALRDSFEAGVVKREEVFVESKLWNTFHAPKEVRRAAMNCLDRLELEHLDLFIIHWPVSFALVEPFTLYPKTKEGRWMVENVPLEETWRAMEDLVAEGRVKHIGVSNMQVRELDQILKIAKIAPLVNQIEVHPYLPRTELARVCKSNGIQVQAYSPLGSPGLKKGGVLMDDPIVKEVAEASKMTAAQVLLKYSMQRGLQPIAKSETPQRIEDNFKTLSLPDLSEENMHKLLNITTRFRYVNPQWRQWEEERD